MKIKALCNKPGMGKQTSISPPYTLETVYIGRQPACLPERRAWSKTHLAVRDNPVHAAVSGDYLEYLYFKRHLFQFDHDTVWQAFGCPINFL